MSNRSYGDTDTFAINWWPRQCLKLGYGPGDFVAKIITKIVLDKHTDVITANDLMEYPEYNNLWMMGHSDSDSIGSMQADAEFLAFDELLKLGIIEECEPGFSWLCHWADDALMAFSKEHARATSIRGGTRFIANEIAVDLRSRRPNPTCSPGWRTEIQTVFDRYKSLFDAGPVLVGAPTVCPVPIEGHPKLVVASLPTSVANSNARAVVTQSEWRRISDWVTNQSGYCCTICGYVSWNADAMAPKNLDAHEVWTWWKVGRTHIQCLLSIVGLCPMCHATQHVASYRDYGNGDLSKLQAHAQAINGAAKSTGVRVDSNSRQQNQWDLDVSVLAGHTKRQVASIIKAADRPKTKRREIDIPDVW